MRKEDNSSNLFGSAMGDVDAEEKKNWKKKEFLNLVSENDIKRRQHAFHNELRKENR